MKKTLSAGGVVLDPKGRVLVVSQHGDSWSLPKGHVDEGEDALAAARREIREESGIRTLRLVKELGTYTRFRISLTGGDDRNEMKQIRMYLFRTRQTRLKPEDPHNPEARWVAPARVAGLLTHKRDKEFFLDVLPTLQ